MTQIKKILAGIGGIGVLLLALYLAAFLFVILLVVGLIGGVYLYFTGGKLRKEFERRQAQQNGGDPGTIEGEYVVVEDPTLDAERDRRP